MGHVYAEEQIHALAKMCEALICNIHWDDGELSELGHVAEGHNAYPASGCNHKTCRQYSEAFHELHFGLIYEQAMELKGKVEDLTDEVERLKTARSLYTNQEEVDVD